MRRRTFLVLALPLGLVGAAAAQEAKKKEDRLSGTIKTLDKSKMLVMISMSKSPQVTRNIQYGADTKFMLDEKPASADDLKEGLRIVAVGKFEGQDLKATRIALWIK